MSQAFNKIFWGYLFVILEIHIFVIDILAEPIGYYFIYSGITILLKEFPIGSKAKNLTFALIFISIPTVFIQQNAGTTQVGDFYTGWSVYVTALGLVKLILVFHIFQLLTAIALQYGDKGLVSRTSKTFYIYFLVMLLAEISNSFAMNFSKDAFLGVGIMIMFIALIMEIVFLVLLRSVGKIEVKT